MFINVIVITIFSNCGYQLNMEMEKKKLKIDKDMKYVILHSYDPFGSITRAIRTELYINQINFFDDFLEEDQPYTKNIFFDLYIINVSENYMTISVFQNGKEAEYQLTLQIETKLVMPNKNCYPINVSVCRFFIRHPERALVNDIQENEIRKEMYQEAAKKLLFQFLIQYKKSF